MIKRLVFDENGNLREIEFFDAPLMGRQQIKDTLLLLYQTVNDMKRWYPSTSSSEYVIDLRETK